VEGLIICVGKENTDTTLQKSISWQLQQMLMAGLSAN
jgi:hypothetical protein